MMNVLSPVRSPLSSPSPLVFLPIPSRPGRGLVLIVGGRQPGYGYGSLSLTLEKPLTVSVRSIMPGSAAKE